MILTKEQVDALKNCALKSNCEGCAYEDTAYSTDSCANESKDMFDTLEHAWAESDKKELAHEKARRETEQELEQTKETMRQNFETMSKAVERRENLIERREATITANLIQIGMLQDICHNLKQALKSIINMTCIDCDECQNTAGQPGKVEACNRCVILKHYQLIKEMEGDG